MIWPQYRISQLEVGNGHVRAMSRWTLPPLQQRIASRNYFYTLDTFQFFMILKLVNVESKITSHDIPFYLTIF